MESIVKNLALGMTIGCCIIAIGVTHKELKEAIDAVVECRKVHKETKRMEQELKDLKAFYGID